MAGRLTRQHLEELRVVVRNAGLRATRSRLAVLDVLRRHREPVTHGEVADVLADEGYDRATVYRNLIDLAEAGIARRSDLGDHVWRFELVGDAGESEVHPHFVCDDCGAVSCLPEGAVQVQAVRGAPKALRGGGVEVRVSGLCDTCA